MRHIKIHIEYDGTDYHGWQSQKSGGTIQDIINEAVGRITGEKVRINGASRTDAGVHALHQVAAFRTEKGLPAEVFARALNANLPADIRIVSAEETSAAFHPRYDATKKSYFYLLSPDKHHSAFLSRYIWYVNARLDFDSMREATTVFIGEHDFSSFRGAGCGAKNPVRTVQALEIMDLDHVSFMSADLPGRFIKFRIEANAFLRHMVRNIVGTLVEVGKGRISFDEARSILESCDRTKAGPTAPAHALFLEKITYPDANNA